MLRFGLLGFGYWGPNLARNIQQTPGCELHRIVDLSLARRAAAEHQFPGVQTSGAVHSISGADDIDAVVIATPIRTHYELALEALRNGKHVLVEKPMATSSEQCENLIAEAQGHGLTLMVDHTFLYTESVRWIAEFIRSGELGEIYYFDSIRANLGLFQHDASVLWDLAPHDLSILQAIMGRAPLSVMAAGSSHAGSRVEDIVNLNIDFGDGCLSHFHVSWLSPVKVRRILIVGSRKMIVFDDLEASEKIRVYDSGVAIDHNEPGEQHRMMVQYRIGDMLSPALRHREALQAEIEHFAECVNSGAQPLTDGQAGLGVVKILEAAQQSLEQQGARVTL